VPAIARPSPGAGDRGIATALGAAILGQGAARHKNSRDVALEQVALRSSTARTQRCPIGEPNGPAERKGHDRLVSICACGVLRLRSQCLHGSQRERDGLIGGKSGPTRARAQVLVLTELPLSDVLRGGAIAQLDATQGRSASRPPAAAAANTAPSSGWPNAIKA